MLIKREQARKHDDIDYASPVPGLVGDNMPTTGDVHLYADPGTGDTSKPILFADCEGMAGGEGAPMGLSSYRDKIPNIRKQSKALEGMASDVQELQGSCPPGVLVVSADDVLTMPLELSVAPHASAHGMLAGVKNATPAAPPLCLIECRRTLRHCLLTLPWPCAATLSRSWPLSVSFPTKHSRLVKLS